MNVPLTKELLTCGTIEVIYAHSLNLHHRTMDCRAHWMLPHHKYQSCEGAICVGWPRVCSMFLQRSLHLKEVQMQSCWKTVQQQMSWGNNLLQQVKLSLSGLLKVVCHCEVLFFFFFFFFFFLLHFISNQNVKL